MRAHVVDIARYSTGEAAAGKTLTVYRDQAMTDLATLYTARTGGTTTANPVVIPTNGLVDFWCDDSAPYGLAEGDTVAYPLMVLDKTAVYNVCDYGALGDGATDDTEAIQAAIDAQVAAGVGAVYLPAGTYMVHLVDLGGIAACVDASGMSNGGLYGDGMGTTTIKMIADPTYVDATGGDDVMRFIDCADVFLRDLTVDGNSANSGDEFNGIRAYDCERLRFSNVRMLNHGGGTNECGGFQLGSVFEMTLENCIAECTKGKDLDGSGFMDNGCWNVTYTGCRASGHTWCGFTTWESGMVSYVGCHAYSNWGVGFNCEYGRNVTYSSCIGGGMAARYDSSPSSRNPHTSNEMLGNGQGGFSVTFVGSDNITYNSCQACFNGKGDTPNSAWAYGLRIGELTDHVVVSGGCYNDNNFVGILFDGQDANINASHARVSADTMIHDNDSAPLYIAKSSPLSGGDYGPLTAPTFPTTGTPIDNPYPWPVMVFINLNGASVTSTTINGNWAAGSLFETFVLQPGGTCEFAYTSGPPGWTWYRA